jgi:predicted metal-dependent HD superfamily phosphohydrolase
VSALFTELQPLLPALQEHIEPMRARYEEECRHYHNWSHVDALLGAYRDAKHLIADQPSVLLAILYHDAVYDPKAPDNEEKSADLMVIECDGLVPPRVLNRAYELVHATKKHEVPASDDAQFKSDCALFLDIDLSILGADKGTFSEYESNIHREYAFVPEETYREARKAVLTRFLERERIYYSDFFFDALEERARENLKRSIERL